MNVKGFVGIAVCWFLFVSFGLKAAVGAAAFIAVTTLVLAV